MALSLSAPKCCSATINSPDDGYFAARDSNVGFGPIGGVSAAYAQNAVEQLQPLVETTARRLMIGQQVALAKWDSGKVVEDTPREAQVILGATKDGVAKGLDEASVSNFFKAQIEANKFVQYALLADWYRAGKAPEHAPVDLLNVVRPQLDEVQKLLVAELVATAAVRTNKTCHADVANAVGKYVPPPYRRNRLCACLQGTS